MRRFDTVWRNVRARSLSVDFPNVVSNGTVSGTVALASTPLGTHILSDAPTSDASAIEDMQIQWYVIAANLLRFTLHNPTGGAIDAGAITWEFVTAELNPDIIDLDE